MGMLDYIERAKRYAERRASRKPAESVSVDYYAPSDEPAGEIAKPGAMSVEDAVKEITPKKAWEKPDTERTPEEREEANFYGYMSTGGKPRGWTDSERAFVRAVMSGYKPPEGEKANFEDVIMALTRGNPEKFGMQKAARPEERGFGGDLLEAGKQIGRDLWRDVGLAGRVLNAPVQMAQAAAAQGKLKGAYRKAEEAGLAALSGEDETAGTDAFMSKYGIKRTPYNTLAVQVLGDPLIAGPSALAKLEAAFAKRGLAKAAAKEAFENVTGAARRVQEFAFPGKGSRGAVGPGGRKALKAGAGAEEFTAQTVLNKLGIDIGSIPKEGITLAYAPGTPYYGQFRLTGVTKEGKLAGIDVASGRYFEVSPAWDAGKRKIPMLRREPGVPVPPKYTPPPTVPPKSAAQRESEFVASYEGEPAEATLRRGRKQPDYEALAGPKREELYPPDWTEAGPREGAIPIEEVRPSKARPESTPYKIATEQADEALEAQLQAERLAAREEAAKAARIESERALKESDARITAAEKGIVGPSLGQRIVQGARGMWHRATRQFEHLPSAKYGNIKFAINKKAATRNYANEATTRHLEEMLGNLDPAKRSDFARKTLFADLEREAALGRELPFGLTPENLKRLGAEVDARSPEMAKLVAGEKQVVREATEDLIKAAEDVGVDLSFLRNNEDYFRHQVIDKYQERTGQVFGKARPQGRGALIEREGFSGDINANYAQSRYETLTNMMEDAEWYRLMKEVGKEDIGAEYWQLARDSGKRIEDVIPEGYVVRDYLGEKFQKMKSSVDALGDDILRDLGADELAAGVKGRRPMILPEEVAKTLDDFHAPAKPVGKFRKATGAWKWWALNKPSGSLKYHLRNIGGDIEGALNNPRAIKRWPQAFGDLWRTIVKGEAPTGTLKEFMKRGGMSTFERVQELAQLAKRPEFSQIARNPSVLERIGTVAAAPFKGYKKILDKFGDLREGVMRYADFIENAERLKASGGKFAKHADYGASIKEEVDAIDDIYDKAFKIANERFVAYDSLSVTGKKARETMLPFWSWKEGNAKRFYGIIRNAAKDGSAGGVAATLGRKLGGSTVGASLAAGRAVLKLAVPTAALVAYNKTFFADEEKDLDEYTRNKPHITLGRNADGSVRVLDGMGAFGDLLAWAGVDTASPRLRDYFQGRASLMDVGRAVAKAPGNIVMQSVNPLVKAPLEAGFGGQLFPDAWNPRKIRDTTQHLFRAVALGNEYNLVAGIPMDGGYAGWAKNILWNRVDPGAAAYNEMSGTIDRWLKKQGKGTDFGGAFTEKGNALYYHKMALRYGDKELAQHWKDKYVALGGDEAGIDKSFAAMKPSRKIPKELRDDFMASLSPEERVKFDRAEKFWDEIQKGGEMDFEEAAQNAETSGLVREAQQAAPASSPAESDAVKRAREFKKRREMRTR